MATSEEITQIYIGFFNRGADPIGFNFWESTGLSQSEIAQFFIDQDETRAKYPFLSETVPAVEDIRAFLNDLYLHFFDRTIDQAGSDFWVAEILNSTAFAAPPRPIKGRFDLLLATSMEGRDSNGCGWAPFRDIEMSNGPVKA